MIRTIGIELVDINYQRGFCIEFASTVTVVRRRARGLLRITTYVPARSRAGHTTGAREKAWCLLIHADASLSLSLSLSLSENNDSTDCESTVNRQFDVGKCSQVGRTVRSVPARLYEHLPTPSRMSN